MSIHRIPRIAMPGRDVSFCDYVIPRNPVIITNLFDGPPIAYIDTVDRAREALGEVAFETRTEYSLALGTRPKAGAQKRTGARGDVMMAGAAEADGPISPAQNRVIPNRTRQLAFPHGLVEKIVYNKFGKPSIDALTKMEAALLIRALSSPGSRVVTDEGRRDRRQRPLTGSQPSC